MAKRKRRKKPIPDEGEAPLNDGEDIIDIVITASYCFHYDECPDIGLLITDTRIGHYAFVVTRDSANALVQALREFIAGDSEPVLSPDDE